MQPRLVEPEILDHLEPQDPAARHSRGDLRRLNGIMGHPTLLAEEIAAHRHTPITSLLDVGGGDGWVGWKLLEHLPHRAAHGRLILLDRQPIPSRQVSEGVQALGWTIQLLSRDVLEWAQGPIEPCDCAFANLFLHHFQPGALSTIFNRLRQAAPLFLAAEPARTAIASLASSLVGLIGCNHVTRHDARVSVKAGFAGTELTHCWGNLPGWTCTEGRRGLFTHFFSAMRKS